MHCQWCGARNQQDHKFCTACGGSLHDQSKPPAPSRPIGRPPPEHDPALGLLVPINTSVLAVAAGYAALFAVLLLPAPIALILGLLALRDLKRHPDRRGKVRAWLGIVLGALGSAGLGLVLVALLSP